MASTDARPIPKKNTAFRFYFAIRKPSDMTLITTWAGQDSEVSLDGAAFADCTNEATEIGTSGCGYVDLTAAEMNADAVTLKVTVTNTGSVPLVFVLYPEEAGDIRCDATQISGDSVAADNAEAFFDGTGYAGTNNVIPTVTTVSGNVVGSVGSVVGGINTGAGVITTLDALDTAQDSQHSTTQGRLPAALVSGRMDSSVGAMATDTMNANALAADALAEISARVALELGFTTGDMDTQFSEIHLDGDNLGLAVAAVDAKVVTVGNNVNTLLGRITATLFSGITSMADWIRRIARGDAGTAGMTTAQGEINTGGTGTFSGPTDALESIRDQGDAAWITGTGGGGTGTGARTVTVTVVDPSAAPVQNATVRFSRTGETFAGQTDASGVVVFNLDDATWTVSITATGFSFAGATMVVNGTETATYTLTTAGGGVTPSTTPLTTGYFTVYDNAGVAQAAAQVSMQASSPPVGSTGIVMEDAVRTATADANGVVQFSNLVKGATYTVYRTGSTRRYQIVVPTTAGTTVALTSIVG